MAAPIVAAGVKFLPFALAALSSWFGGRRQNQAARRAHDARYGSNPRFMMRNALLTQMWNEHNLADRFKDAFPDPSDPQYAGQSIKTPENVLRAATSAPRFEGGGGAGLLDSILASLGRLPAPSSGGGGGVPMPAGGPPMPPGGVRDFGITSDPGDPLDPFTLTDPLKLPMIPFRRGPRD